MSFLLRPMVLGLPPAAVAGGGGQEREVSQVTRRRRRSSAGVQYHTHRLFGAFFQGHGSALGAGGLYGEQQLGQGLKVVGSFLLKH